MHLNHENAQHQHHLINVVDHGPQSCADWFEPLKSIKLTDISALPIQRRLLLCGILDLDLAIDLSGWTSGHFLGGFLAKLAPVQCSYLGFLHPLESKKLIIGLVIGVCSLRITTAGIQKLCGDLIVLFSLGNLLIHYRKQRLM